MVAVLVGTCGLPVGSGGLGKQDIPCGEHLHLHPPESRKEADSWSRVFSTH